MWGYSGFHELRRVAVYLLAGEPIPRSSDDRDSEDPLVASYYSEQRYKSPTPPAMISPNHRTPGAFKHLLLHSDAEGFYLPMNFRFVLFPDTSFEIAGGPIGSSIRLAEECRALASAMHLPADLDPESDEFADAEPAPEDPLPWRRLPFAAHACLTLLKGCEMSIARGAALVFS